MTDNSFFFPSGGFSESDLLALEQRTPLEGDAEGQLAVDVYQTPEAVVVQAAIAGVAPDGLQVSIHNDVLTIRGRRERGEAVDAADYFTRECYWGTFSRSVVLPIEVRQDKINAVLKNGILTITLPKAKPERPVKVKLED